MYEVPKEYYFRLHHIRSRFKNNLEEVLLYMANATASLERQPKETFDEKLYELIRKFPGNFRRKKKTINNWRTEITSLFGLLNYSGNDVLPGRRAVELSKNQDIVQFFKYFLFTFQYPGAHIKPQSIAEQIQKGVKFKPAQYILRVLKSACEDEGKTIGISKAEVCHCIFNDLRCTRDSQNPLEVWKRIKKNRTEKISYDNRGDVIRYAGDILDYMVIANLLRSYDNSTFYLNNLEEENIQKFITSAEWFNWYDNLYSNQKADLGSINSYYEKWFSFVNRSIEKTDFSTDIIALISKDDEEYKRLTKEIIEDKVDSVSEGENQMSTKEIGDFGEALVYEHECHRLINIDRAEFVHLIKRIPTHLAVGYDILSIELDSQKRFIEVKTTISSSPIIFNRILLTTNEWAAASTLKESYYIYRLNINKYSQQLFLIQDPVGLYKKDIISMIPRDGAEIVFDTEKAGTFEELLR